MPSGELIRRYPLPKRPRWAWMAEQAGGGTTLTLSSPGVLTLAAASSLAPKVTGQVGTPGALVLAVASGLAVAVDTVREVTAGILLLVIASGVTVTGVAAQLGRALGGFLANIGRLMGR